MKKLLVSLVVPIALMCGQAAKTAKPAGVPDGAKEVAPYAYSYIDAKGTKWLYRQTPFGIVKLEDKEPARPVVDKSTPVVTTDLGDTVKFQKQTPFGQQSWTKKKVDLTDEEKTLLAGGVNNAAADTQKVAEKQ